MIELCKIVCEYVEKYEDRLFLLNEMLSVVNDEELLTYLKFLIHEEEFELKAIQNDDTGYVYELHIKETPDSYDERYLCNSYQSALNMIDEFYKEYDSDENESSRYEIVKRKIYDSRTDSFEEDFYGKCTLNYERKICEVFYHKPNNSIYDCDGFCFECDRLCIHNVSIKFPPFVGYKDLVRYIDYDGKVKFGVSLDEPECQAEECYIIPLDCFALRYKNFEKAHDFHEHTPYPQVERANVDELCDEEAEAYKAYLVYLEEK